MYCDRYVIFLWLCKVEISCSLKVTCSYLRIILSEDSRLSREYWS
uniref:Uncharacterized protein n=1 Tax=Arundo donax TaxID=35708 RepID=A0A0A9GLF6_ARUDO